MGGTTAKLTLLDDLELQRSRQFEVARAYRFVQGSGLPVRIPVIELVEIGAGGGSIARIDALGRIQVGPDSAGSVPGPASYGRGGTEPTVTDADTALGRLDPKRFAGGAIPLHRDKAEAALQSLAGPLKTDAQGAAAGVAEIVDETMASAARVHAVENGKDTAERTLIAFGGAAPLHAARLARKLGMKKIVVPVGAGVGSAFGFLRAPIAYEVVRTRHLRLDLFDAKTVNGLFTAMREEAEAVVRLAAPKEKLVETRLAFMRYRGQGHEIAVPLPNQALDVDAARDLRRRFEATYETVFGRIIPKLEVEALTWTLSLATDRPLPKPAAEAKASPRPKAERPARGARSGLGPAREGRDPRAHVARPRHVARRAGVDRRGWHHDRRAAGISRPASTRWARSCWRIAHEHAFGYPPAGDVEPPALRRRGAGPRAGAHRLLDQRARGGRHLGRRVRPRRPDAGPGRHRHAGPRELDGAQRHPFHPRVPGRDHEAGRRLRDQRSVEGHRPSLRHRRHLARLPQRQAGGAVLLHHARRRHRRARPVARRPAGLSRGPVPAAAAPDARRQDGRERDAHRARQRARAGPGRGRPPCPDRLQRHRREAALAT